LCEVHVSVCVNGSQTLYCRRNRQFRRLGYDMDITKFLGATAIVGVLAALPGLASAQTAPAAPPRTVSIGATETDGPTEAANDEDSDNIVVTGSRIRLKNITGFSPTTTVTQAYLLDRGLTNVADALNEIPGIRGSVTPNGAQGAFGQGVNFINTLGLGSNRTLTLVNGRRFVSSNVNTIFNQAGAGVQVDVNVIPTLLINEVEFLSIAGAPIYGSDAIAGTVNYKLNTRLKGVLASVTASVTEEGDAFRYNAAVAGGFNFAQGRGNITLAYTRDQQDGLLFNSRDFLRDNIGGGNNPSTAQAATLGRAPGIGFANDGRLNTGIGFNDTGAGFPGLVQVRDRTIPLLTRGGLITDASSGTVFGAATRLANTVQNFQFDNTGNLTPFNRGIRFLGPTEASGGDGFRFNDFSQITSELRRNIFNGFASFKVSPALELFVEGNYFNSRGDELVQQPSFNSSLFGALSGPLTFDVNNPFLTNQARGQLVALGVNRFQVSRASLDLADLTGFSTNDLYRGVVGARGDFQVGGRNFNYEVSANYGRVDITDTRQDINAQNFINAVNVTRNAGGQIVCTATPTFQAAPGGTARADAGCVPLNLFGEGVSSQAARDYIIATNVTRSSLQQYVFNANVGGSPFRLFGNETGFNLGYEHRQEFGSFTPSAFEQAGLGRAVAILPVGGNYKLNEVFGEAVLPVITSANNISFINALEFTASGRYVHNTVNGNFVAYSGGARFSPIRDITFRGTYTKSFRAPAITELFSALANVFATVPDLCSPANRIAGLVPATRTANCNAFLAVFPNATPLDAAGATVPGLNGGNPNLRNEVSRSFSYGVVIQPRFIPGLTITADYVNVKIADPIANLGVAAIAGACFDNANFNTADPANGNAFCSQIRRFATGQGGFAANGGNRGGQVIVDPVNPGVRSGFINGNRVFFDGIQGAIDYIRPLSGLGLPGRAGLDGTLFFVRTRITDLTGIAPVRTDGTLGDPTWQGQVNLRYVGEGFGTTLSINYTGEQLFSRVTRGPAIREIDKLRDFVILNPNIFFNVNKKFRLTLSVSNLLNRQGQNFFGTILPASFTTDGQLGRRFNIGLRGNF